MWTPLILQIAEYLDRGWNGENGISEISPGKTDKFRGGFFFEGNSWGRYVHLNLLKSHAKVKPKWPTSEGSILSYLAPLAFQDFETGDFKRYSWIVHPLAYRATLNKLPDNNCVDSIQVGFVSF